MGIFSESLDSLSLLWPTVIGLLIVFFLLPNFWLQNVPNDNLENLPPSPPRLPIIDNLHQLGKLPHVSLYKLSQIYGPVMHQKLGQVPALVISSQETAKEVLKIHDTKCCNRPDSYGMRKLTYNHRDFTFCPYGDYWREMRKLCVIKLFTFRNVHSFQHFRGREIAKLMNILSKKALDPNQNLIHLDKKIFSLAKNITCEVAFGISVAGEKYKENEIQKTLQDAMR